jgi:hypothetical protein
MNVRTRVVERKKMNAKMNAKSSIIVKNLNLSLKMSVTHVLHQSAPRVVVVPGASVWSQASQAARDVK